MRKNDREIEAVQPLLPVVVSVNMYKYNYYDNRIISEIKNKCQLYKKNKHSISVSANNLLSVLVTSFKDELDYTSSYPIDRVGHAMTTVYQLYNLLRYYKNIKIVNINISFDKNYSKLIDGDKLKMVALDYKIDKIILRYDYQFDKQQIKNFNSLLRDLKIIKTIKPLSSYSMYLHDYLMGISELPEQSKTKYREVLEFTDLVITDKVKIDNPIINIVTDF